MVAAREEGASLRALPVIDADRCVHAVSPFATCTRCAAACPSQALVLGSHSLTFNEEACTGCGLCRPECPQSAIALATVRFDPLPSGERGKALAACEKAAEAGRGTIPCLHALSSADLDGMTRQGCTTLLTARGDCATCQSGKRVTLEQRVVSLNVLRRSRGEPDITVQNIPPAAWHSLRTQARGSGNDLDQGRRALFAGILSGNRNDTHRERVQPITGALCASMPVLDLALCTGCDACARICPHHAISLEDDGKAAAYVVAPGACTGCGLCVDVCEAGAVSIAALQPAKHTRIPLRKSTCTGCGAPFKSANERRTASRKCPVCARKGNAQKLFQVRP